MPKLADMTGVREYAGENRVELWRDDKTGRLVIRAFNECGCNCTDVDLIDLISWLRDGPDGRVLLGAETATKPS